MSQELSMKLDQLETFAQQIDSKMDMSKTILFETTNQGSNDMMSSSDANQNIFNLISQLNEDARQEEDEGVVVNGSGNVDLMDMREQGDSFDDINNNSKFSNEYTVTADELSKQMQSVSLDNHRENEKSTTSVPPRPQGIPTLFKSTTTTMTSSSNAANSSTNSSLLTKIPRISSTNIPQPKPVTSSLPSPSPPSATALPNMGNPLPKQSSTLDGVNKQLSSGIPVSTAPVLIAREKTQTISTYQSQSVSTFSSIPTTVASSKLQQPRSTVVGREPRSVSKSNSTYSQSSEANETVKQAAAQPGTTKKVFAKRGASCTTRANNKTSRSMSINPDNETSRETLNNDGEPKFNADGTRNVKYIVRHKPRESQVKIFSQKMELKNVTSKIGSLDNYDHKPAGGSVVIESKELNWKAESKIGSLEKAANYVPAGGNVKIETRKLNWNAKSKIGSLEYANYQPKGGNVKIETQKLNFKEKAKPRTDTGLIVIETKPGLNRSNSSTSDNMSSYSGSCHEAKN